MNHPGRKAGLSTSGRTRSLRGSLISFIQRRAGIRTICPNPKRPFAVTTPACYVPRNSLISPRSLKAPSLSRPWRADLLLIILRPIPNFRQLTTIRNNIFLYKIWKDNFNFLFGIYSYFEFHKINLLKKSNKCYHLLLLR